MTLLERLRNETRQHHLDLESAFRLPETKAELAASVGRFFGFLEPLEARIALAVGPAHELLRGRQKTPWLREDLRSLGRTDTEIAELARCPALPQVGNLAAALGISYVMEGSTLGGQLISRHIEKNLGLSKGVGYRYFVSYGSEVGRRWQEFRELMVKYASASVHDEVVAAANATFARLSEWSRLTR